MIKQNLILSIIILLSVNNHRCDDNLLDSSSLVDNNNKHTNIESDDYDRYFGALLDNLDNQTEEEPVLSRQKRFLGKLFDKLLGKDKKSTTTRRPYVYSTSRPKTSSSSSSSSYSTGGSSYLDDPFYKLRKYCILYPKESLCGEKQKSMKTTLVKCEKLKISGTVKQKTACGELLSIYCYIYSLKDVNRCYNGDYERYVPGSATTKKVIAATTRATATTRRTTTKRTTRNWYKPITTKYSRWDSPATTKKTPSSNGSPFDGPVRSIPESAAKLEEIGKYCLKLKKRDSNCDKMLSLLKGKFKKCEKQPKSNRDCHTFKINFCTAFKTFPCCADALAGRTCSGKKIN